MVESSAYSHTDPQLGPQEEIDVYLLPTHVWEIWVAGAYKRHHRRTR